VQKHRGTISFDTAEGTGTTFKIGIPINDGMPAASAGQLELGLADAQPAAGAPLQLEPAK